MHSGRGICSRRIRSNQCGQEIPRPGDSHPIGKLGCTALSMPEAVGID